MEDEHIKINRIEYPTAALFNPQHKCVGYVRNDLEFNDVRIQVKQKQLEGYYFMFAGKVIDIDKDGGINKWPDGFFTHKTNEQLNFLLGID